MVAHSTFIRVGDQTLTGTSEGSSFTVSAMTGWWKRPNAKRADSARDTSDGDANVPWHFEARNIGVAGTVRACSHDAMHDLMDRFSSLATTERELFTVIGHGRTQTAEVEADAQPEITPVTDKMFNYQLRFKANDPVKYGPDKITDIGPDSVTIEQSGRYNSFPVAEIHAQNLSDQGFRVDFTYENGTVKRWWYQRELDDYWNVIDFSRGLHLIGTTVQHLSVRSADSCFIPPKGQAVRVRAYPVAGGQVSGFLRWADAWI